VGLDVSYPGAFLAGLLSFLSPCVLPIVPPYLAFLGGITLDQVSDDGGRTDWAAARRIFYAAIAFVLGFTTVFVALGATASAIGDFVGENKDLLAQIAGAIIIVMGIHFLGILRIPFLYREARVQVEQRPAGLIGAYIVGLAFAFGWTPCVGPVLTGVLFVAGAKDTAWEGASLLAAYAFGIGLPFLVAALFAAPFLRFMARFRRFIPWVERALGVLLIVTGVVFITGSVVDVSNWILETFPALGRLG
jgi:cytochrome c-type biogenesis protein